MIVYHFHIQVTRVVIITCVYQCYKDFIVILMDLSLKNMCYSPIYGKPSYLVISGEALR